MTSEPSTHKPAYKADTRVKRRNIITAVLLTLFFVSMITAAVLGPQFFQGP